MNGLHMALLVALVVLSLSSFCLVGGSSGRLRSWQRTHGLDRGRAGSSRFLVPAVPLPKELPIVAASRAQHHEPQVRWEFPRDELPPNNTDWNTYLMYLGHYRHLPMNPGLPAFDKDKVYALPDAPAKPDARPDDKPAADDGGGGDDPEDDLPDAEVPKIGQKPRKVKKLKPSKKKPVKRKIRVARKPPSKNSPKKKTRSTWIKEVINAKPKGQQLWHSLPDSRPKTSTKFKAWLKLVDLKYEGGEADRALSMEGGDPNRAAIRLAREYSGFSGLHCLSKGNCFGDPRQANFKVPQSVSVPERPPKLQELPPLGEDATAAQKAAEKAQKATNKRLGIDYSAQIIQQQQKESGQFSKSEKKKATKKSAKATKKITADGKKATASMGKKAASPSTKPEFRQEFEEAAPPTLNPFKIVFPKPSDSMDDRKREVAPLRSSESLGVSEQQDAFTKLMRTWLTTMFSPFHTKKPGSTHESDADFPKFPGDTHMPIVPVKMQMKLDRKQGVRHVKVEWHQPPALKVQTLQQLKDELAREERLEAIRAERESVQVTARAAEAKHHEFDPVPQKTVTLRDSFTTQPVPVRGAAPAGAEEAPAADALTPAQQQDAELSQAQGEA